ncbi:hypothetical protein Tco_1066939 [Tanacetum coccineum]|uniref:Uncharacterized protein n=1 Tax=Tanacetum coccineum TaxID=301880 RepID=A0ABQ5HDE0_9ASTR
MSSGKVSPVTCRRGKFPRRHDVGHLTSRKPCRLRRMILDEKKLWKEERVRLLAASLGASTTPISSPGPSTTPSDFSRLSRNAECSNCKLLTRKIKVLEETLEIYMHLEQHTLNSTALLHEVYHDTGKLGLE